MWVGFAGRAAVALIGAMALAACAETNPAPTAEATALAPAPIVKRENVDLTGATVALVTLDGAPQAVRADFLKALSAQLSAHGVAAVEPKKAHYLLRGYLAANSADGGANLDYVLDVYDARRQRVARLSDGFGVKGSGDVWSLMSTQALESAAEACANDIAAYLSNAPEAAPATGKALSYAE